MCLAIPSQIIEIKDFMAVIDVAGVRRQASLLLIEDPRVGDWVIVHAGFAIQKLDEAAAQESLRYLREAAQLLVEEDDSDHTANTGE
jgi:hydrogenase expression/formation protein HypC